MSHQDIKKHILQFCQSLGAHTQIAEKLIEAMGGAEAFDDYFHLYVEMTPEAKIPQLSRYKVAIEFWNKHKEEILNFANSNSYRQGYESVIDMFADYNDLNEKVNDGRPTNLNIAKATTDSNHEHHQLVCEVIVIESVKALLDFYDSYNESTC